MLREQKTSGAGKNFTTKEKMKKTEVFDCKFLLVSHRQLMALKR
jgi:hypothetical protein